MELEVVAAVPAPTKYKNRKGDTCQIVNKWGWTNPRRGFAGGELWEELLMQKDWIHLGWCPEPDTKLGWFLYHYRHGRMMRYPWLDVVVFSWRHGIRRKEGH